MGIRKKIALVVSIGFLTVMGAFTFGARMLFLEQFSKLEKELTLKEMDRVHRAVDADLKAMVRNVRDWASWDQSYQFMADRDPRFVASTVNVLALEHIGIHFLYFVDRDRNIVQSFARRDGSPEPASVDPATWPALSRWDAIFRGQDEESPFEGIVMLRETKPILLAAAPILNSDGKGPSRGTLIFGRYLDQAFVEQVARTVNIRLSHEDADDYAAEAARYREAYAENGESRVFEEDDQKLSAYAILKDAAGKPAVHLKANFKRELMQRAFVSLRMVLFAVFYTGVIMGALMLLLLERFVTTRLVSLSRQLATVGAKDGADAEGPKIAPDPSPDEIGHLNRVTRQFLERIAGQQKQINQSAKMAALGDIAGGVSQELDAPLQQIRAESEAIEALARAPGADARLGQSVTRLRGAAERIRGVAVGLKRFAQDGNGQAMTAVSLQEVLVDTQAFCQERFKALGIDVTYDVPLGHVMVRGRGGDLAQAFLNLLANSRDALANQKQKWVRVSLRQEAHEAVVTVEDAGHGLPPHVAPRIFEPFFTTKTDGHHSGLGLSMAHGLVHAHGGTLRYDAESSHTRFVIRLPLLAESA